MLEKLAKLESLSRQLDPGPAVRKKLFDQVRDYSESFLERLPETKTYVRDDGRNGFIASPIYDGYRKVGVLIFQMPLAAITEIMGERAGLGNTGETYMVGPDMLMRSDSYLAPSPHRRADRRANRGSHPRS